MGQAAPEAHLRDELGLAEGTHVCGQHCWAAQQGPWASRVVGSNLRVDHLLDLREEGRAFSVRKSPSSPPHHMRFARPRGGPVGEKREGDNGSLVLSCGFPPGSLIGEDPHRSKPCRVQCAYGETQHLGSLPFC